MSERAQTPVDDISAFFKVGQKSSLLVVFPGREQPVVIQNTRIQRVDYKHNRVTVRVPVHPQADKRYTFRKIRHYTPVVITESSEDPRASTNLRYFKATIAGLTNQSLTFKDLQLVETAPEVHEGEHEATVPAEDKIMSPESQEAPEVPDASTQHEEEPQVDEQVAPDPELAAEEAMNAFKEEFEDPWEEEGYEEKYVEPRDHDED